MTRCGLANQLAVELDNIRAQVPDAAQVGLAGTKIIECDEKAMHAQMVCRFDKRSTGRQRCFQNFDGEPRRRDAASEQVCNEPRSMNRVGENFGPYIDEKNAGVVSELRELTGVASHALSLEFTGAISERCAPESFHG